MSFEIIEKILNYIIQKEKIMSTEENIKVMSESLKINPGIADWMISQLEKQNLINDICGWITCTNEGESFFKLVSTDKFKKKKNLAESYGLTVDFDFISEYKRCLIKEVIEQTTI